MTRRRLGDETLMTETDHTRPSNPFLRNALSAGLIAALLGVVAYGIVTLFDGFQILDDGYFYARYAHHLVTEGTVAWNPGAAPSFGPTSLGWVFALAPLMVVFPTWPAQAILVGCAVFAGVFALALLGLIARDAPRGVRLPAMVLVALSLGLSAPHFAAMVTSGMDTAFALTFVPFLLWAYLGAERRATTFRAIFAGAVGGLAFVVRPDLLLFAFAAPTAMLVLGRDEARRSGAIAMTTTGLVLGAQLLAAQIYFGRPLPLSFYAKSTGFFSDEMHAVFVDTPQLELLKFALSYRILLVLILIDFVFAPRRWWRATSPVEKGITGAAVLFITYYLFFVLQMMGENARFYYPTLPVIAWLATRSLARLLGDRTDRLRDATARLPIAAHAFGAAALVALTLPAVRGIVEFQPQKRDDARRLGRFDIAAMHAEIPNPSIWYGIREFAQLDGDFTIATTEVGVPGVVCIDKTIADLSGLNEPWIVDAGGFTAEAFFEQHRPDILYQVFDTYPQIRNELENSRTFRNDYDYFPDLGTGIAVRRDSPHHGFLIELVAKYPR